MSQGLTTQRVEGKPAGVRRLLWIGLLLLAACDRGPRRMTFRKETIARLPTTYAARTFTASEDGKHFGYLTGVEPVMRAVWNDVLQPPYARCRGSWIAAGGRGFTYFGADADSRVFIVVDGVPTELGFVRRDFVTFNADATRWAAVSGLRRRLDEPCLGERGMITVDGVEVARYPDASVPAFSADSKHIAYLAATDDGQLVLIVDGQERQRFPHPTNPCFSTIPPIDDGPWLLRQAQIRFLSDGRLLMFGYDADGWAVYRDQERLASYPVNLPGRTAGLPFSIETPECMRQPALLGNWLTIAEKAPVGVWWERLASAPGRFDAQWRVVRDGQPVNDVICRRATDEELLTISPNGQQVAYACVTEGDVMNEQVTVLANDRRFGPYRAAFGVAVSDDGQHVAYGATETGATDDWHIYRDGTANPHAYIGNWRPRFTADGRHLAWQGQLGRDYRGVVGIDAHELAHFDEVLAGPILLDRNVVSWVIRRRTRVRRFEVHLPD